MSLNAYADWSPDCNHCLGSVIVFTRHTFVQVRDTAKLAKLPSSPSLASCFL